MPFTCPRCGAVSHHPKDEEHGYCGRCHEFTGAAPLIIPLGDMTVVGFWPGKMMKALAVIAAHLHPAYDASEGALPGNSKESCLFSSLAVRDFLVAIGFEDATVRACGLVMRADDPAGTELHSLGIGVPGDPDRPHKFNGHAVVTVPHLSLMIDTTLYQAIRPAWGGALTGLVACEYREPAKLKIYDRHPFAGWDVDLEDRTYKIIWLDRPELNWKRQPDFAVKSARRRAVTRVLVEAFGVWSE
jgi:hypothetical protein